MKFSAHPDSCSCCEGVEARTPLRIYNRPGLPALSYRIGTHGDFLESMLARLSSLAVEVDENGAPIPWDSGPGGCGPESPPGPGDPCAPSDQERHYLLRNLTTRNPDDAAIALLDAWAVVADVLTFYQERIANEGYLRTALERRSVQELARLVGYKLRPGVAASVYLAFELDKGYQVEIPAGTRAQSVPQPGELPQPFETSDILSARYAWNAISARSQRPQYIALGNVDDTEKIYLEGLSTQLKANDPLLFVFGLGEGQQAARYVQSIETVTVIEPIPGAGYTIVELQPVGVFTTARRLVSRNLPPGSFSVPTSGAANAMTNALNTISQAGSLAGLRTAVQDGLRIARNIPPAAGSSLSAWLQNLKSELSEFAAQLQPTAAVNSQIGSGGAFPFLAQTGAQVKEPARRFASGSNLPRNLSQILSPGGGAIPEMITALQPRLKKTFYAAWGSAQTAPSSALQQVAALRAKAAPFGYNAAPMPILDDQGALVGETEWPLASATSLQVTLPVESEGPGPIFFASLATLPQNEAAGILVKTGGQTYFRTIEIDEGAVLDLPIGRVEVVDVGDESSRFQFDIEGLEETQFIRFTRSGNDVVISVGEGDEEIATLAEGQSTVVQISPAHRITASYSRRGVRVTDEYMMVTDPGNVLYLDTSYDQILPGSWVLIARPQWAEPRAFQVELVDTVTVNAYKLSGKSTRLVLSDDWLTDDDLLLSDIRSTTIYAQSEPLKLVDERYDEPVENSTIELDGLYDGLEPGRWIFVRGERTDIPGASRVEDVELAMIANIAQGVQQVVSADPIVDGGNGAGGAVVIIDRPGDKAHTTLELAQPLDFTYDRKTVKVYANVAKATHGATVRETIGSGDARKAFQTFTLRQVPLTCVPAPTPSGAESTLEMRVNDIRWPEVEWLYGLGKDERGYELRRDDDGEKDITSVIFGDGRHGVRLPTGSENVEAVYRSGIGKIGNVPAETIKMLLSRPLGVKAVNNLERASGGADRDDRDAARRNAPLAVMALDRLVSTQDYADFARMFAGVAKANSRVFPRGAAAWCTSPSPGWMTSPST